MPVFRAIFAALLLLCPFFVVAQTPSADFFPMEQGTYWIYAGTVKWTVPQDAKDRNDAVVKTEKIRWKMKVAQSFHKGKISAALMKGHPADLAWYENDRKLGDYLLVRKEDRFYFLHDEDATNGYRDLVKSGRLPGEEHIFLALPLKPGKHFCDPEQEDSPSGWYCWSVDNIQTVDLQTIQGVASKRYIRYELAFRTGPDHEFDFLVPGIGITRWIYSHHGTVSDVDVHLIEFHRGAEIR